VPYVGSIIGKKERAEVEYIEREGDVCSQH